jgi:Na+/H+-dicarboxylate symporter
LLRIIPVNPFETLATTYDLPGTILFAVLLGLALARIGERGRALRDAIEGLGVAMSWVTDRILLLAPIGVFALLLQVILSTGFDVIGGLAKYVATVSIGLFVHGFVTLPALYFVWTRRSPVTLARHMAPALMMSFTTASSSATLPVTYECMDRAGVDRRVSSFVLPLGATVNMDGTALYQAVAAIFIAQAWGIELGLSEQVVIFLTASLAAIGAAGVPSAGLVTMIIVLQAVGLPLEGIGMVVAVDRVLDMMRTTVNVWGDSVGAAIIGATEEGAGEPDPA